MQRAHPRHPVPHPLFPSPPSSRSSRGGDPPPPAATEIAPTATTAARQVYTPADFARYAPVNAYDMLAQVPGFQIRDSEELRGLGQATGNVLFNGERPANKADDMYHKLSRIPGGNFGRTEFGAGATPSIPGQPREVPKP